MVLAAASDFAAPLGKFLYRVFSFRRHPHNGYRGLIAQDG